MRTPPASRVPLAAALLLAALAPSSARPQDSAKAEAALKPLRERAGDPKNADRLRADLIAFRRTHYGTPAATAAAELLARLPSPLDRLRADAIPSLDLFPEWQPKEELVAVLGEHQGRQGGEVRCVAFSPDGKWVASGGATNSVRVWDTTTMRQRGRVLPLTHTVHALAWSSDGKTLAAGNSHGQARVWDMNADPPRLRFTIPVATSPVYGVALNPGGGDLPAGSLLATAAYDSFVRLHDLREKEPKEVILAGHKGPVRSVAFSPDGKTLASGGNDQTVRLWDLAREPPAERAELAHAKEVVSVAYSGDGKVLAAGMSDGSVKLWNVTGAAARERGLFQAHKSTLYQVAFARKGLTLATASADRTARVWEVGGKVPVQRSVLESHVEEVYAVAFAPDDRTAATGGADWTVRLWSDLNKAKARPVNFAERPFGLGHLSSVSGLAFAPDGQTLASGGHDRTARLWGVTDKAPRERSVLPPAAAGRIHFLAYAPDGGTLAAGGTSGTVQLYDAARGGPAGSLPGNPEVRRVAFTPDGRLVLALGGKHLVIWDARKKTEVRRVEGNESHLYALAVSPDGKRALAGGGYYKLDANGRPVKKDGNYVYVDPAFRVYDLETGRELLKAAQTAPVGAAAFAPDGKPFLGTWDSTLREWDLTGAAPKEASSWKGASASAWLVLPSPDGRQLLTLGLEAKLILWGLEGRKRLKEWRLGEEIGSAAFSPDGRYLALSLTTGPIYLLRLAEPPAAP